MNADLITADREAPDRRAKSLVSMRVVALRKELFALIDDTVDRGFAADPLLACMTQDLQTAANSLAAAERALQSNGRFVSPAREEEADPSPASSARQSAEAAIVLALAATTLPFAGSPHDEVDRWLRTLRLHGRVGEALRALGIPESRLETLADPRAKRLSGRHEGQSAERVVRRAEELAGRRGSDLLTTLDILFAVMDIYGGAFNRALYERGTSRDELIACLAEQFGAPAPRRSAAGPTG